MLSNDRFALLAAALVVSACGASTTPPGGTPAGGIDPNAPYAGPTTASWTKSAISGSGRTDIQYLASFATHKTATFAGWGYDYGEYALAQGGGLLVTRDDGATWTTVTLPPSEITTVPVHHIYSVASDGTRVYVSSGAIQGILVSDDDGATWTKVPAPGGQNANGYRLGLYVVDGKLWAGRYHGGLYVSADRGATWTELVNDAAGSDATGTTSVVQAAGHVFEGTWNKIYDLGPTLPPLFNTANHGIPFPGGSNQLLSLGTKVFSISTTSSIHAPGDLYVTDASVQPIDWKKVDGVRNLRTLARFQSAVFAYSDNDTHRVAISTDGGKTWLPFDQGLSANALSTIGVGVKYLYSVNNGEIWRTPLTQ